MSRRLRAIAQETVAAVERGFYRTERGAEVVIADQVTAAVTGTRLYLPDEALPAPAPAEAPPVVEVTNETTLAATRRLGGDPACLVFASARNPGGGFLNGAQAQEESIARGSALYPCLRAAGDFYARHRTEPYLGYSDRVIYSPAVPVFRDDGGAALAAPYPTSFLTSAAPNRSAMLRNQPEHLAEIPAILRRRAARVLAVAAAHGHRTLVLGAWGCGVFGNEPATVADAFAEALRQSPWFAHVVFAVFDRQADAPTYAAFRTRFG
ncbi:TIGR02452 family protein [Plantactinospora sp. S1510]|uniref:TIGR02452 family protein n=1 Tax=Plantactinospora alkalitolerans TaxID=2789879 RepID=A0ABS0H7C0_9ACTN|nr:TIGR02452 family protein [Plantactinospora alkalitolerans]MBF9134361.1 TIGR02452 family protein [Plantactinospora alkalitolerans]